MDPIELELYLGDGSTSLTMLTPLGDGRYRLEETPPLYRRAGLGAIVSLRQLPDGEWKIVKVHERPYRSAMFFVSREFEESPAFRDLCSWSRSIGGACESMIRGIVLIHAPRDSEVDLEAELARRLAAFDASRGRED